MELAAPLGAPPSALPVPHGDGQAAETTLAHPEGVWRALPFMGVDKKWDVATSGAGVFPVTQAALDYLTRTYPRADAVNANFDIVPGARLRLMVEPEIVARLDPQLVSQTVHQFLRLAEAYPEAAREMKILQIRDYTERAKDDPSLAYTNLLGATTIWSDVLERGSPIEHVYAGQVRIGEIVPSEHGLEAIITHVFGHIMERSPRQYRSRFYLSEAI